MSMRLCLTVLLGAALFTACGGSSASSRTPTPEASPTPRPANTQVLPTPEPRTEVRVAYINLSSPFPLQSEEPSSALETMDDRLAMVIAQLKKLDPDIVAFSQVSWSEETGGALAGLAAELKMEFQYARSAPWLSSQSREESDELVEQLGWEEGLLVLSKDPILSAHRFALPGRDNETGNGEVALHVTISAPVPDGVLHVYVAEFRDDDEKLQIEQAADLRAFIAETSAEGVVVVMGSFGPDDSTGVWLLQRRLTDLELEFRGTQAFPTCCRVDVVDFGALLSVRSDFIMTNGWLASEVIAFGHMSQPRADGTALYMSTHNGLMAVLPLDGQTYGSAAPSN